MTRETWARETTPCRPGLPAITVTLTRSLPDTTVCTAVGKIDMDTTPVLRDALTEARGDDNAHLVIDLSAVTSMDSAGLYVLFEALHKHNIGGGGHLAAVIDTNSRRAIPELHLVALQAAFDLHHDLAGALQSCVNVGAHSRCGDPSRSGDPLEASVRAWRS